MVARNRFVAIGSGARHGKGGPHPFGGGPHPFGGSMRRGYGRRRGHGIFDSILPILRSVIPGLAKSFPKLARVGTKIFNTGKRIYDRHGDTIKQVGKAGYEAYKTERNYRRQKKEAAAMSNNIPASEVVGSGRRKRGGSKMMKGKGKMMSQKYNGGRHKRHVKKHIRGRRMGGSFISNIQPGPLP